MKNVVLQFAALACVGTSVLLAAGCGQTDHPVPEAKPGKNKPVTAEHKDDAGHQHAGWWCDEHGVPESECSQCNAKVAAAFKKKGDWCNEHDRAKSQCFLCNPKLKEKYAAVYRGKYGKEPPPTEDDEKANTAPKKHEDGPKPTSDK